MSNNICVIGGAGHVGAPLGLVFSSKGYDVTLIDKDKKMTTLINILNLKSILINFLEIITLIIKITK